MSYFQCRDGEIIDLKTAEVVGKGEKWFIQLPPLSTNAKTLLRHWDGVSAEELGSIPTIHVMSKDELYLLEQIRPFKFLVWSFKQDYAKLIKKINDHRFAMNQGILARNMWKKLTPKQKARRVMNMSNVRRHGRVEIMMPHLFTMLYRDPIPRKTISEGIKAWIGTLTKEQLRRRQAKAGNGLKRSYAFKISGEALSCMYSGIILDADYPCPHCGLVFTTKTGRGGHVSRSHKIRLQGDKCVLPKL